MFYQKVEMRPHTHTHTCVYAYLDLQIYMHMFLHKTICVLYVIWTTFEKIDTFIKKHALFTLRRPVIFLWYPIHSFQAFLAPKDTITQQAGALRQHQVAGKVVDPESDQPVEGVEARPNAETTTLVIWGEQ